jgi:drug/metabolite transporter (DMT)-like permease
MGYVWVFLSMFLYALFEVLYKKFATPTSHIEPVTYEISPNTHTTKEIDWEAEAAPILFLGLTGVETMFFFFLGIPALHFLGWETFEFPTGKALELLFINGTLDCIFNVSLLIGIMCTSPLFMSVGSLLTIPASVFADFVGHQYVLPPLALVGVLLIIIGFLGLNIEHFPCLKRCNSKLVKPAH